MSDSAEETTEDQPEPEATPRGEPAYKVIPLTLSSDGVMSLGGARRHTLPAKVYDRKTAIKYAANEAQQARLLVESLIFAVVNPVGRCVAVLASGTGKPVRPLIGLKAKRALAALLPGEVVGRRRSSRPLAGARAAAKPARRRSSRVAR